MIAKLRKIVSRLADTFRRFPWRRLPLLYCLGSILIFGSWLSEKAFQQKFKSQHDDLDRLQSSISSNHNNAQIWYGNINMLESVRPSNKEPIAYASLCYIEATFNILRAAKAWGNPNIAERQKFGALRDIELQLLRKAYNAGKFEEVITFGLRVREYESKSADEIVSKNYQRYNEITNMEETWSTRCRVLYIIGAVFIAISFIRKSLAKNPLSDTGPAQSSREGAALKNRKLK